MFMYIYIKYVIFVFFFQFFKKIKIKILYIFYYIQKRSEKKILTKILIYDYDKIITEKSIIYMKQK